MLESVGRRLKMKILFNYPGIIIAGSLEYRCSKARDGSGSTRNRYSQTRIPVGSNESK